MVIQKEFEEENTTDNPSTTRDTPENHVRCTRIGFE